MEPLSYCQSLQGSYLIFDSLNLTKTKTGIYQEVEEKFKFLKCVFLYCDILPAM